jgi:hypothetical protein
VYLQIRVGGLDGLRRGRVYEPLSVGMAAGNVGFSGGWAIEAQAQYVRHAPRGRYAGGAVERAGEEAVGFARSAPSIRLI